MEFAPAHWAEACTNTENRLHQLAPYIGKLKSTIASSLIKQYTSRGDTVLDTFCGSGTVPLECKLLGRNAIAVDSNPYAVLLTRAKLEAPASVNEALAMLEERLSSAVRRPTYPEDSIPSWVRNFFHPETLQSALKFADECLHKMDYFLLACLLGILHHQRPGFLSYPCSHLVPYLRDRKFPLADFPELYEERQIGPRLRAKVQRALRTPSSSQPKTSARVAQQRIAEFKLDGPVDAIVTSPPYMNALDYIRDNRLRMWFLDRSVADYTPEPTDRLEEFDRLTSAFVANALQFLKPMGRCVLVVGETVRRKKVKSHPAERMLEHVRDVLPSIELEHVIEDVIPDVRRTRRSGRATKKELILVLRRRSARAHQGSAARRISSDQADHNFPLTS